MDESMSWLKFFDARGIPYAVVIVIVAWVLARLAGRTFLQLGERFPARRLVINQVGSLVRFSILLLAIVAAILTMFTLTEQLLLAIGGTLAVAVGFASKDLAASVLAGITILVDKPFQVGDRVTFEGYYGEIVSIGLRSIKLMTLDDTQVTIPNNKFLTEAVASGNAGAVDMMVQVDLFVGVDQNLTEARRILTETVTTSRFVSLARPWRVNVSQVDHKSYVAIRLRAAAYVLDVRFEKAFVSDVTERALAAFRQAGIRSPAILHRSAADVADSVSRGAIPTSGPRPPGTDSP